MKSILFVVLIVQFVICFGQRYSSRYDHLNIDQILSNKRVLNNYVKCILDEGPCTAEGRELRAHIPDALQTTCVKCTEAQKNFVKKGSNFLIKNHPKEWSRISKKYDPQGQYSAQFHNFLKS